MVANNQWRNDEWLLRLVTGGHWLGAPTF